MLRQPIIALLGHVDHGKTSLLDRIRETAVASKEAGGITQAIGTTEIPLEVVDNICGLLSEKFKFNIDVPGLLFIDTPGHEAFTTLRKRGGLIADLAILIIDINEGIMPQTQESIDILKTTKTPFVIALNKIDRIHGWSSRETCFLTNYNEQSDDAKEEMEKKFYEVTEQLSKHGFNIDRYDRVQDFKQTIAAVPISSKTGEGVPDLLIMLIGLAQQFLKEKLEKKDVSEGMILEVKELKGMGTTIDTIIYNGSVDKNDYLVIGGKNPKITKIKALLIPEALRDIRTEKKFRNIESINAAAGVKIAAPGINDVVAGSILRTAKSYEQAEKIFEIMEKEREEVEISSDTEGLILKADTVGSLEALIQIFKDYPIKEAHIGNIAKQDLIKAEANKDEYLRTLISFNITPSEDIKIFAKDKNVKILTSNIIYELIENYQKWVEEEKEAVKQREIASITRPGKLKILPGCTFRASNPAIIGCEITGGVVKSGYSLFKPDEELKVVGEIKQIQSQGQNIEETKTGEKVAVSILGPTMGRQIDEGDELYTDVSSDNYKSLMKNEKLLSKSEKTVLKEIYEMKKKQNPRYGL